MHWMWSNLAAPDKTEYEPFCLTPEQQDFIFDFYEVDDIGRRVKRRGVYSRPKGSGKSPLLGSVADVEALGPVVFDHFAEAGEVSYWLGCDGQPYAFDEGEPVGKPWRTLRTPFAQLSAVSEDQTHNAWDPLLEMLREAAPVRTNYPGLEPLQTFVNLPNGGKIEFVTASARSREGNKPIFCVLDQTEAWLPSNGGTKLAAVMRRNVAKTNGTSIESPNAYLPGEGSVAEASAQYWNLIKEGKTRDDGLLYDHREAPADTELTDRDSLMAGLRHAYGCSACDPSLPCPLKATAERGSYVAMCRGGRKGWVDLDRIAAEVYDPDTDPQDGRRFYLNQITHATDSYISELEWKGCLNKDNRLEAGDVITLGFDGSRGRAEGKPDATALVACRVEDGFEYALGVWEAEDTEWDTWSPPMAEIEDAIGEAFRVYNVAAFYADPARDWRSDVNRWEAAYWPKLVKAPNGRQVKVTNDHPFEWWMLGGRSILVERAVKALSAAIRNGEMSHAGQLAFTRHMLNARKRTAHAHLTVGKASSSSPRKIDACVAAILAHQARLDCIAAGIGTKPKRRAPIRVR
jgi:hypothetical protein